MMRFICTVLGVMAAAPVQAQNTEALLGVLGQAVEAIEEENSARAAEDALNIKALSVYAAALSRDDYLIKNTGEWGFFVRVGDGEEFWLEGGKQTKRAVSEVTPGDRLTLRYDEESMRKRHNHYVAMLRGLFDTHTVDAMITLPFWERAPMFSDARGETREERSRQLAVHKQARADFEEEVLDLFSDEQDLVAAILIVQNLRGMIANREIYAASQGYWNQYYTKFHKQPLDAGEESKLYRTIHNAAATSVSPGVVMGVGGSLSPQAGLGGWEGNQVGLVVEGSFALRPEWGKRSLFLRPNLLLGYEQSVANTEGDETDETNYDWIQRKALAGLSLRLTFGGRAFLEGGGGLTVWEAQWLRDSDAVLEAATIEREGNPLLDRAFSVARVGIDLDGSTPGYPLEGPYLGLGVQRYKVNAISFSDGDPLSGRADYSTPRHMLAPMITFGFAG